MCIRDSFQTQSDCEVILALYKEKGTSFLDEMNGIFAFALYDADKDEYFIARDHMGIIPLYMGWDANGTFYVASELKALEGVCTKIELFPPGHFLSSKDGVLTKWYSRDWMDYEAVQDNQTSIDEIHDALEAAVHRQLMSDVPYGVLLSGGLDSSVISAIAKKYADKRIESDDTQAAWWPQLHSFSVGLEGSPDLAAAQVVADHIGTVHHEIKFTIQEGLDERKFEREKDADQSDKKVRKGDKSEDADEADEDIDEEREKRTAARKSLTLKAPAKKGVVVDIEEEEEEVAESEV